MKGLATKIIALAARLCRPVDRFCLRFFKGRRDQVFYSAICMSVLLHFMLVLAPFLLRGCAFMGSAPIPEGSGQERIEIVKMTPREIEKRYVLAHDSPFLFRRPDVEESEVLNQVDQTTENTYVAQSLEGSPGEGEGKQGGWPEGMPGKIRFVRLKYAGGDWDQDMGAGADHNFLLALKDLTGFPVAARTEAATAAQIKQFRTDRSPPFVYITGKGLIGLSASEIEAIRWYCLEEGGVLWADNGGGSFDASFRQFVGQAFPGKRLIDIANDDPIYRHPYSFPDGAPPLWHHSGYRALGVRHDGRWVVFYHQGDMNDAWKDGHSGASEWVAMQSHKMGVNIAYYAFSSYLSSKARKSTHRDE